MNATVRRMDQIINIFAPLSVGQVMTWASNVVGCGFILGWNLVSLLVEFIFLSKVYQMVPQLAIKPQQPIGEHYIERQLELLNVQAIHACLQKVRRMLRICTDGWKSYYRQSVFLAGLGLAFLYTTVLGFDCITTGYAYTQGISGSLLSLLMAVSAISGLMGTFLFTRLRRHYGLMVTGIISSCLHVCCLMLCVFSVFAPGSPFDLGIFSVLMGVNSSINMGELEQSQVHLYPPHRNMNQPILPDRSSIHWTNNTVLLENIHTGDHPDSYISIILLFLGVILARIGWPHS
ncbi:hypothetical protein XENTR_v10016121 [Xenopus tropicalis]|nr:hypothetical protein XENTR_v10016121 [Xenopus tropicalis]